MNVIKKVCMDYQLSYSNFEEEIEGKVYHACHFQLENKMIYARKAKVTPKKIGQFVTCWKRNGQGETSPFDQHDKLDVLLIWVEKENHKGVFLFPKVILKEKGILTIDSKEGKRGFRVYPSWDKASNKQAIKTQQWQLDFFLKIDTITYRRVLAETIQKTL